MLRNISFPTISKPEFIEITPCNDLISECEIKVLYVGENRNLSYISKEVATQMANTLPGTPIVAAFNPEKNDFSGHGHVLTIEDGETKVSCTTVPYGFVAPDAKVWFQKFIDVDAFGEQVEREYLMTTGYLWTGQYPEIQKAISEGLPQSMELSENTDGYWATENNSGVNFFIINDTSFTKLCILGSDVEPCFEGASVTAPDISREFAANDSHPAFVKRLLEMKKELSFALESKGGSVMPKANNLAVEFEEDAGAATDSEESVVEEVEESSQEESSENTEPETTPEEEPIVPAPENLSIDTDDDERPRKSLFVKEEEEEEDEEGEAEDEKKKFAKKDDEEDEPAVEEEEEEEKKKNFAKTNEKEQSEEEESEEEESEEEEEKKEKPSSQHQLQEKLAFVKSELHKALEELDSLKAFKLEIENQRKDAEIAKYYMLSEEDKAEIVRNKSSYSLEEIKSQLALLYVEKNVDFSTLTTGSESETPAEESFITTFSLDSEPDMNFNVSPWVQSMLNERQNN